MFKILSAQQDTQVWREHQGADFPLGGSPGVAEQGSLGSWGPVAASSLAKGLGGGGWQGGIRPRSHWLCFQAAGLRAGENPWKVRRAWRQGGFSRGSRCVSTSGKKPTAGARYSHIQLPNRGKRARLAFSRGATTYLRRD